MTTRELDAWLERRRHDRKLDARLARIGYKAGSRHIDGCQVGSVHGANCICREIAAGRAERKRRQPLLYR